MAGGYELDQNIQEYKTQFTATFKKGPHAYSFGRAIRTNYIINDVASDNLIKNELLSSGKTFAKYAYTIDTLNSKLSPTQGTKFVLSDEIAIGDVRFNKFEVNFDGFMKLLPSVALQTSFNFGLISTGLLRGSASITDKFSYHHVPGYTSMGKRSVDEGTQAKGKYGMAGDDMGGVSKLDFSAKIHFYSLPILEHL